MSAFLRQNDIAAQSVIALSEIRLNRVKITPTVIVVDKAETVIGSWGGAVDEVHQQEIVTALEGAKR